jgi:Ca2+-binding EF-hand superfamily protein
MPNIKKECWKILLRVVKEDEFNKYKAIFQTLDYDDDGVLSKKDLLHAFNENKI